VSRDDEMRRAGGPVIDRPPRFYLTQFGAIWRATPAALEAMLEGAARTGCYDLHAPEFTRMRETFSEASYSRREGFLPRRWRCRSVVLLMPLDQPQTWFASTLAAMRRGDYNEMRGFTCDEDVRAMMEG